MNLNRFLPLLFLIILIQGCGINKGPLEIVPGVNRPKIALVLGGGAARGFRESVPPATKQAACPEGRGCHCHDGCNIITGITWRPGS